MKIYKHHVLSQYTTINIGGKARFFCLVETLEELTELLEKIESIKDNFFILGGGSNIIINSYGYNGYAIKLSLSRILKEEKNQFKVEAGVNLSKFIKKIAFNGFSGLEKMYGIPGTIGGAIRGNAGAYGQEIKDCLVSVDYIYNSQIKTMNKDDCNFKYRDSVFKRKTGSVILSGTFKFPYGEKAILKDTLKQINLMRKKKHPLNLPNAGSFFKNPFISLERKNEFPEHITWKETENRYKISAAWLIEKSGLKGFRIGDIGISNKHSLFFVNLGKGTSDDVIALMKYTQKKVYDLFKVNLDPEVEFIGIKDLPVKLNFRSDIHK